MTPDRTKELLPVMQAHAEKKQVESRSKCFSTAVWVLDPFPTWDNNYDYRIAPWKLTNHIEGFRELVEGEEWHRSDFKENMLPKGYRPLLLGEARGEGDEHHSFGESWSSHHTWFKGTNEINEAKSNWNFVRTTRPLPKAAQKVPLEESDILPGTFLRHNEGSWVAIDYWDGDAWMVNFGSSYKRLTGNNLLQANWQYHHPSFGYIDGVPIWKPCYKYE